MKLDELRCLMSDFFWGGWVRIEQCVLGPTFLKTWPGWEIVYMPLILTYRYIFVYVIFIKIIFVIDIFLDSHIIMYNYHQNEL